MELTTSTNAKATFLLTCVSARLVWRLGAAAAALSDHNSRAEFGKNSNERQGGICISHATQDRLKYDTECRFCKRAVHPSPLAAPSSFFLPKSGSFSSLGSNREISHRLYRLSILNDFVFLVQNQNKKSSVILPLKSFFQDRRYALYIL